MIDCVGSVEDPTTRLSLSSIGCKLLGFPGISGVYVFGSPHPSQWIVSLLPAHNTSATQLQKMSFINPCAKLVL